MYDANRRNFFIRSIAVVAGDIAIATALASACLWLIEVATHASAAALVTGDCR